MCVGEHVKFIRDLISITDYVTFTIFYQPYDINKIVIKLTI